MSRRELRRTLSIPISTHGVPPIRSRVENMKPCSLSSIRAVVANTQSSLALDRAPMSNAPSIEPNSSRSASVNAMASLVATTSDMSPSPGRFSNLHCATEIVRFHKRHRTSSVATRHPIVGDQACQSRTASWPNAIRSSPTARSMSTRNSSASRNSLPWPMSTCTTESPG